jgi:hypothetical protein
MKVIERAKAREMRRNGFSIKEIEEEVCVSRSSVSIWVRDIKLTEEQTRRLIENGRVSRARGLGAKANKEKSKKNRKMWRDAGYIRARKDSLFRTVCALYWGEGAKTTKVASIANCDSDVLSFWGKWLVREGYKNNIGFRVHYYSENGLTEDQIKKWWMSQLPFLETNNVKRFTRCIINRASQKKKVGKLPYGTGHLTVCRLELLETLMGGINFLRELKI